MKRKEIFLLILFIFIVIFTSKSFVGFEGFLVYRLLLWAFLGIILFFFFPMRSSVLKKKQKWILKKYLLVLTIYYLIIYGIGLFYGFAYNSYDHSILGILKNTIVTVPIWVIWEYVRMCFLRTTKRNRHFIVIIMMALLASVYEFSIVNFSLEQVFFLLIPTFLKDLFLSFLCYYGNFAVSLGYLVIPYLINISVPILPDFTNHFFVLLELLVSFSCFLVLSKKLWKQSSKIIWKSGILGSILIVGVLVLGIFVLPNCSLVVASNSMLPNISRGDVVFYVKNDFSKLEINDIIVYRMDNKMVVHRVYDIYYDKNNVAQYIITKGDNNKDIDIYPVLSQNYYGTVKFKIPLVGYFRLILYDLWNGGV